MPATVSQVDASILLFIQNHLRTPLLNEIFRFIANYGLLIVCVYAAVMLLWDRRKIFPFASACVVSGFLGKYASDYIKHLIKRPRPFRENADLISLTRPKSFSCPSGHTTVAFAVAFIMWRILPKKYSVPALCMAALIAFSRIYMGVHNPTDILVGILVAYIVSLVTDFLYKH